MLFRINSEENVILDAEAIKLCPGLKKLSSEELLFVVLAFDYKSPYKQFPEEERVRKAQRHVWGSAEKKDLVKKFSDEIELYKALQYDSRRETIIAYSKKVVDLNRLMAAEDSALKITQLDNAIEKLLHRIDLLQEEVDKAEEVIELKGGGRLTLIERWQKNMIEHKKNKASEEERYIALQ